MARVRVSTTVDSDLLAQARSIHQGEKDASLIEAALRALLKEHLAGVVDAAYLWAYRQQPVEMRDEWGDLTAFLDAAARPA